MDRRDILRYPLVYIGWILSVGFSLLVILRMYGTLNLVWPAMGGDPFVLRGVGRFFLLLFGLGWLAYVVLIEWYYRSSISKADERSDSEEKEETHQDKEGPLRKLGIDVLLRRFATATSLPLALFALDYIVRSLTLFFLRQ